jgi:hypothetical protein
MPDWLVLLLTSLGAWCGFSFALGLLIGPLFRKRDELLQALTAFALPGRSVKT